MASWSYYPNTVKSVNMIKSFLVKPKEINSIEVRRHNIDSCCFDPKTISLLERIDERCKQMPGYLGKLIDFVCK